MSQNARHTPLIILGSGPAGYTAAVYAARANLKPVLITGMAQGGQLMTTTEVDNWPAAADGIQGPELMANFEAHAKRFDTEIIFDHIHTTKLTEKPFTLVGDSGRICHSVWPAAASQSTKWRAPGPRSPEPWGPGRLVMCSSTPLVRRFSREGAWFMSVWGWSVCHLARSGPAGRPGSRAGPAPSP